MKRILVLLSCVFIIGEQSFAGNPDRRGEAGAAELLMNGWAQSSGLWSMNTASVAGVEAERINPAGIAFTQHTEIAAAYALWLQGSGVGVAHVGFAQNVKDNVISLSFQALNLGSIERTTTAKPAFINIGLSYARKFSNSISGGVTFRFIDEGLGNLNAVGFALDAGLQYVTGPKDNIHFGVSLRNVGTPMKFSGDALATSVNIVSTTTYTLTEQSNANKFELPTQLNIGGAYDIWMGAKKEVKPKVFRQDYRQFNAAERLDVYTGLAAGATFDIPFKKEGGPRLAIDYSFRATSPFQGTHSFGLRLKL